MNCFVSRFAKWIGVPLLDNKREIAQLYEKAKFISRRLNALGTEKTRVDILDSH